jgi:type II secretory pathway component PulM
VKPRDRRALLAGGLVLGLAFVVLRLGPWMWRSATEQRTGLEARTAILERMRAEVRGAARLEDSGMVVKGRLAALAPKLLAGGTASEATADLAGRLDAAAARHRVRVSRTDPVHDTATRRLIRQVALRAELESDSRGLFELLHAVTREPAILLIDSLRIVVTDPFVPSNRPELLRTNLRLSGWFLLAKDAP